MNNEIENTRVMTDRDNREVDNQVEDKRLDGNHRVEDKQLVDSHTEEEEQGMHKELHNRDDRDYYNHDDRKVGIHLLSGGRILCHCDYADPRPLFFKLRSHYLRVVKHCKEKKTPWY